MNASIDSELVKLMQEHVTKLSSHVNKMAFESQEELCNLKEILENTDENLQNCEKRVKNMELTQDTMQDELSSTIDQVEQLKTNQEVLQEEQSSISARVDLHQAGHEAIQQRVTKIEGQQNISYGFSDCTSDIEYFAGRYDPDTRLWLLQDFNKWFSDSGNSRAYVLLGDAAVGKSVVAAVVAQRAKKNGSMAAAYFCRHYDGTRRDPRYLLGTISYQLCICNSEYDRVVGGESAIQNMLTNTKLGVHELFTKLLEEPLSKCGLIPKKLVVIDALDEAEYLSRKDFLDLIINRFLMLPKWLVFFITSRPEDIVHFQLQTYNPCIRICAGNSKSAGFYKQHKQDIQRFLENKLNFVGLPYTAEQLTEKCNGMFLYAFYIAEHPDQIKDGAHIFPDNINEFFYKNFERVKEKIGDPIYRKLFGCALVAPSPLPVSFISFLLKRENNALNEQEVIDAVSLFVALRTSDKTFAFLHGLIPSWLSDEHKASRELFIDKVVSSRYFTNIIVEFLHSFLEEQQNDPSFDDTSRDVVTYILVIGFRLLYQSGTDVSVHSEIVFRCLTNYCFLKQRLENNKLGIYSLLEDLELSVANIGFHQEKKAILDNIASVLREDKYIVLGSSELLASCLQKASQLTQANIRPPNFLALSGIIQGQSCNAFDHAVSVKNIFDGMQFCTFSHDKRFLAGAKGHFIFLYHSVSFQKKFGPIEVVFENDQDISHLEFSPDDEFIFFGRLDRWLSVEEERVVEKTQFTGNFKCYEWGSFISNGQYIAVSGQIPKHPVCLRHMLSRWAIKELALYGDREFCPEDRWLGYTREMHHEILLPFSESHKNCENYEELDNPEMDIRERISFYYADIFERQIWNVETGRPVLEEMFSSQIKSMPFFYLWHIFSVMPIEYIISHAEDIALHDIAIFHAFYRIFGLSITVLDDLPIDYLSISEERFFDIFFEGCLHLYLSDYVNAKLRKEQETIDFSPCALTVEEDLLPSESFREKSLHYIFHQGLEPYLSKKIGRRSKKHCLFSRFSSSSEDDSQDLSKISLHNRPVSNILSSLSELKDLYSKYTLLAGTVDKDLLKQYSAGKSVNVLSIRCFGYSDSYTTPKQLVVSNSKFKLFEEIHESIWKNRPTALLEMKMVDNLAFIHDDYIIYVSGQKLFAVSLQTGTEIESTSTVVSFPWSFEYYHHVHSKFRYIFKGFNNEAKVVSLQDLPGEFVRYWFRNYTKPIQPNKVTFTSPDSIIFLFADGLCLSYNLTDKDMIQHDIRYLGKNEHSTKDFVKKCTFSHDGKIIAMHQGSELILFKGGKFLCSVFNIKEEREYRIPYLIFSTDNSLLLFCIQKGDGEIYGQPFYVWDVTNRVFSHLIRLPYTTMRIESVCFSSDITKLYFCNAMSVLVLDYPPNSSFNLVHMPNVHRIAYRKCNYCTVSSDNKLLACCIGNKILILPVNGSNSFWNVPNNHTGRIEYCKFLRENRYLISYGVDGVVFLFDLSVWKSIAYVSQESIISMAMSPDEDKIVSLGSSGEIRMVKLFGLKYGLPPNFELPSDFRVQANNEKQESKIFPQKFPSSLEKDYLIDITFSDHSNSNTSSDED
ncbi:uncharacterized protein LOC114530010 isoform X2 [Dendronephthya gigantea]|uniref:uncharacterized protein LOC114530010 isoform X2 n=1 Tax=Dendronephthya gigantea TaxID=151771 RepID=UPI00106CF719|nr:uncharacterized protein LOC114530010 isoform X2 [Dendronephthya gigantea]